VSTPGQPDVQSMYVQYQNAVRQLQMLEQQVDIYTNLLEQYRTNLETLNGLKDYPEDGEFIFPLSDMVHLKANFSGIKEVMVDVGSDYLLPTTFEDAVEKLETRIEQFENLLERFSKQKNELETIASGLQNQLNQFSRQ